MWGVRINESQDNHDFYTRTNAVAHELDDSRQTGGVRYLVNSELLEDVFTRNDFGFPLQPPNHPLYLNTEFNGPHVSHQAQRQRGPGDGARAGGTRAFTINWLPTTATPAASAGAPSTTTRTPTSAPAISICYHGVSDIFRIAKPAGHFYRSQCDPKEEIVLEPCFNWSQGDQSEGGGIRHAVICLELRPFEDLSKRPAEDGGRSRPGDLWITCRTRRL